MIGKTVFCLWTLHLYSVTAQGECTDIRGRIISHGLHYVPGPDTCTLCICDNGLAKVCKAVLCSPPQDCRSFRVGTTCCEFICLDDVVKPADGTEANIRVAAGCAISLVLVTIALVVYRVRKQKTRRTTHTDDQRSLTSIGYISGSMGYMGGTCETSLGGWKPPSNYLPRGEAPPPYDEVIAQCRADNARVPNEGAFHRTYPTTMEAMQRPDDNMQCNGHGYINMTRPVQQIPNTQNCYNAPLLQPVYPSEVRESIPMTHLPNVLPACGRLTGSLGAISGRLALAREPEHDRPHNVPGFYATHLHPALHRTIPRISTAGGALELGGAGEVRRSFHRDTRRAAPRHLDLAPCARAHSHDDVTHPPPHTREHVTPPPPRSHNDVTPHPPHDRGDVTHPPPSRSHNDVTQHPPPAPAPAPAPLHPTLPLTVDKPSCVCSYESGALADSAADEVDDYRSECENCKSASSSRWVLEEPEWAGGEAEGTQTLQRRAPPPAPPPPATATLPQPVTKQPRNVGPPSNWENWFNTIPDSDTESEEE